MARERSQLANGVYLAYPIERMNEEVIITVLQTTTGGGSMMESGMIDASVDLNTGVRTCKIKEGAYVGIISGRVIHPACKRCGSLRECQVTGEM